MKRRQDWPQQLHTFIDERLDRPFEWGIQDCVLFAADGILRMTDEDILAGLRGQWTTAKEATDMLAGYGGMEGAGDRFFERVSVQDVQRGDLGLMTDGRREFFGLVTLGKVVGPGPNHLIMNPFNECRITWKVAR